MRKPPLKGLLHPVAQRTQEPAVSAVLLISGLLAAYVPARRAAQVDPMEALRRE